MPLWGKAGAGGAQEEPGIGSGFSQGELQATTLVGMLELKPAEGWGAWWNCPGWLVRMPEAFQPVLELVVSKFVHVPFQWSLDFLQTSRSPSHKSCSFPKLIKGTHLPGAGLQDSGAQCGA